MKSSVRLGLVGVGRWGRNYLTTGLITETRTRDYENMGAVDGVIISTPISSHFEICKYFLERGTPILVEKPMTQTLEQTEKLLEIAGKTGVLGMVGHIMLYNHEYENF